MRLWPLCLLMLATACAAAPRPPAPLHPDITPLTVEQDRDLRG